MVNLVAGAVIGFLLGLTGIGGGALLTPFLLLVAHLHPAVAIGTDLVFSFVVKSASTVQHRRQRTVWLLPAFYISLGSVPASLLAATFIVGHVHQPQVERVLPRVIGGTLMVVACVVIARAAQWLRKPAEPAQERWPAWWQNVLLGILMGLLVGATSIGSGTLLVSTMLLLFSLPPAHLVGLNVLVGAVLAFFPAMTYAWHGMVAWQLLGTLLIGALPGAVLGSRLVTRVPTRYVQMLLGVIIFLAGARLLMGVV